MFLPFSLREKVAEGRMREQAGLRLQQPLIRRCAAPSPSGRRWPKAG